MIALIFAACAGAPPTPEQATAWADGQAPLLREVEGAVGLEIERQFPRYVCRTAGGGQPVFSSPECVTQRVAWERGRLSAIQNLQPVLAQSLKGPIVGIGVLVADTGSAEAGERPPATVAAEKGPRSDLRWVGWGADRRGPFVETLRKMSVGENNVAIRVVLRPE